MWGGGLPSLHAAFRTPVGTEPPGPKPGPFGRSGIPTGEARRLALLNKYLFAPALFTSPFSLAFSHTYIPPSIYATSIIFNNPFLICAAYGVSGHHWKQIPDQLFPGAPAEDCAAVECRPTDAAAHHEDHDGADTLVCPYPYRRPHPLCLPGPA